MLLSAPEFISWKLHPSPPQELWGPGRTWEEGPLAGEGTAMVQSQSDVVLALVFASLAV